MYWALNFRKMSFCSFIIKFYFMNASHSFFLQIYKKTRKSIHLCWPDMQYRSVVLYHTVLLRVFLQYATVRYFCSTLFIKICLFLSISSVQSFFNSGLNRLGNDYTATKALPIHRHIHFSDLSFFPSFYSKNMNSDTSRWSTVDFVLQR